MRTLSRCIDCVGVGVGNCSVKADGSAEEVVGEVVFIGFMIVWMIIVMSIIC
jgi:hypothetical protein